MSNETRTVKGGNNFRLGIKEKLKKCVKSELEALKKDLKFKLCMSIFLSMVFYVFTSIFFESILKMDNWKYVSLLASVLAGIPIICLGTKTVKILYYILVIMMIISLVFVFLVYAEICPLLDSVKEVGESFWQYLWCCMILLVSTYMAQTS